MYLKDPWLWPEVWIINPQIPNPHLIYPGDQLALAYGADGRPHVSVEQAGSVRLDPRLRSSPLVDAIPTITYASIAAFLSRPAVMSNEEVKQAPYVLAFRDLHVAGGSNNEVYIRNLNAAPRTRASRSCMSVTHWRAGARSRQRSQAPGVRGDLHRDRAGAAPR